MYPAPIDEYEAPATVVEVVRALAHADEDEALCLAGGMSAMQAIKARLLRPKRILDLQHVAELRGIEVRADGIRIGAMTRYASLATAPELSGAYAALSDAAAHVGDRQVRNRGTIGGSLCWNYVAACTPVASLGVRAIIELASLDGDKVALRELPIDKFLLAPLETARRANELLVAVRLAPPVPRSGSAYQKWGPITDSLPLVAVAVMLETDSEGRCASARVALGGLPSGAARLPGAEAGLVGRDPADEVSVGAVFAEVAERLLLPSDNWASADYRRLLVRKLGIDVTGRASMRARLGSAV